MSSNILCGPCFHVNTHKNAQTWCTNCEEGFCSDCEQVHRSMKVTRDHTLISTDDYRKIENVPVNLKCDAHGKKFDLYCKSHDVAICVACFPLLHKNCSEVVISLDEAVKNAKRSTALDDLVNSVRTALDNIKLFTNNRSVAMDNIEKEEQSVRKSIGEMRLNVNRHLDDLEKKLLDKLSERYADCKSKYGKVRNHLNKTEKEIKLLLEQISELTRVGSDLQVFLGTRQMNKLIHNEVKSVKSITSSLQDYKIGVEIHQGITSLLENVDNFGQIKVEENTISLPFKDAKVDQAQIVHKQTVQSFGQTRLQLRKKLKIKDNNDIIKMNIRGCGILPNNNLLIADYSENKAIMEYSDDGRHIRDIPVADKPFDFTIIDNDRIAVTYYDCMEILNIKDNKVYAKVNFEWPAFGISYQNGHIYTLVKNEGIVVMDMSGKRLRTIRGKYAEGGSYRITTTNDRIYYTNNRKNVVCCCSLAGEDIWTFSDQTIVEARGLSIDVNQNVFIVGESSTNLTMIQHDGKVSKTLLTASNGLNKPVPVHCNKDTQLLLICNKQNGDAFLYSVI